MENGKGAIAKSLKNGVGFGSTEFHILRPIENMSNSYWLYYLTKFEEFRHNAALSMTGASGHRRVPESFLKDFMVGLPPIKLQDRFANYAKSAEQQQAESKAKIQQLEAEKQKLIDKYFK